MKKTLVTFWFCKCYRVKRTQTGKVSKDLLLQLMGEMSEEDEEGEGDAK